MRVKQLKADYSGAFDSIDKDHPYFQLNVGLYDHPVCDASDIRSYVYLPPETSNSSWSVTLLAPGGSDVDEFLTRTGWKELADEQKIILFVAAPAVSWADTNDCLSFIDALRKYVDNRDHYDAQVFFAYLVGYDDGASAALRYTMARPEAYAGVAFAGRFEFDDAIAATSNTSDDLLPYLPRRSVPVPAYFMVQRECPSFKSAFRHFMKRNNTSEEVFRCGAHRLAPVDQTLRRDTVNAQPVADVRADIGSFESAFVPEATRHIWEQVHRTIRTTGVGAGGLHPYRTLADMNITRHEIEVDGWVRTWYEYVPERQVSRKEQRPLVVFCHGGTQVGESGLYAAEWFNVAESRDFAVVFPSGGMGQRRTNANPMPTWNIDCTEDCAVDDEKFIRAMVEEVSERLNIDKSRRYITGHSMGAGMTQRCLMFMPDLFAAGVSNSGVVLGDFDLPGTQLDYDIATWIEIGEHDVDSFDINKPGNARRTVEYWLKRGDLGSVEDAGTFQTGRYRSWVWLSRKGAPLVRFTAAFDKVHSTMPQDAWSYYDEFMCRYSRRPDGTLCYMNKPVR